MRTTIVAALALTLLATTAAAENWPTFRGPTGQGISTEANLPTKWSEAENIAWKTPLTGEGWSSPIVWDDSVFLTAATERGTSYRLIRFDRRTGKILWDNEAFQQNTRGRKEGRNSYATSTPVTDGKAVYVRGFDGTFAAVDFNGKVLWVNRDFPYYSQHGLAVSLRLYGGLLICPMDPSSDGEDKRVGWQKPWENSSIIALNPADGTVRWIAKRGLSRIGHVTPNLWHGPGGDQLISGAGDVVQGFDLKTGKRLWTAYSQGEGAVPSIVIGDNLVYSCSGFEKPTIRAHRPGGEGDVTKTHLAWEDTSAVPAIPSMLYLKPYLYSVTEGGILTCREGDTGKTVYQERLGATFAASPVAAEGRIYFLAESGQTVIVEAGPQFKVLARNDLGERCQASMAASRGQLFIRGGQHLFCIGRQSP